MVSCWSLWSRAEGAWRVVVMVRHPAHSAKGPSALLRPLLSWNFSVLHKNTRMCTKQRSARHRFPVPRLEEKRSILPPVRWFPSTPPAFRNVLQAFPAVSALLKGMLKQQRRVSFWFFQWCKLSVLESVKKPEFATSFCWPLNHVFLYIERCLWHHLYLSLAVGWKSNLIFLAWFMGP